MPKVSIGICVRNCEDFIKDAVDSIADQDFPSELMELIFVDDGSRDNTLLAIQELVSRISIASKVIHTSWNGLGHARNVVVANAKGDYVLWVDGDMILSRNYVSKQVRYMEQHPRVGIAKGKQSLDKCANLLATLETYSRAAGRMVNYESAKSRSKALGTGGSIYRMEAIEQVGGFDENLKGYGEDSDLETRIRAAGWSLSVTETHFLDYERRGLTWKSLWSRYWLRGYYTHHFLHKHGGMLKHYRMFPPAASLSGLLYAHSLFQMIHRKAVFLLPIQHMFKMSAWYLGFMNSHVDSYEPKT